MAAPAFFNSGAHGAGTGVTRTPGLPASRANGNILIAICLTLNNATHAVSGAGWSLILPQTNSGTGFTVSCWWRVVDGSETSPVFSWTGSVANAAVIKQYSRSNFDNINPFGAIGTPSTGSGTNHTSTEIVTTQANSLAIYIDNGETIAGMATPAGWSENWDQSRGKGGSKVIAGSGVGSGNISVLADAAGAWVQFQIELREAVVPAIPQTISASCASVVSVFFKKSLLQVINATATSTVSAFKRAGKLIASTISSIVSTSSKSLATVIINASVSAVVTTRRAVGKAVTVSASAATSIVKRANKAISTTAFGVVSVTKRAGKNVSVIQNMFVTITRQRAVEISAAVSSAVTVSRGMFVRISAAVSSAVTVAFESVVSWLPLNVYRSGVWIVGKLRTYRSGSWVRPKLKRYVGGVWIDVE